MSEERKKPGVLLWTTVVVVAIPLLYVAGIGPLVWMQSHGYASGAIWDAAMALYWPLDSFTTEPFASWLAWYADLWR